MWYKVNKIRVGTQQVRPVWKFSYDFRNKSVSQIQSDWWVTRDWSYSTGSSWIYTSRDVVIWFPVDCSNATKITITWTANSARASYWWFNIWLTTTVTTQTSDAGFGLYGTANNPSSAVTVYSNWSRSNWNDIWVIRPWTYTATVVIDLLNKTISWSVPNIWTSTLSLNNTQVSAIKSMKWLMIYLSTWNTTTVTFSDVSITIE